MTLGAHSGRQLALPAIDDARAQYCSAGAAEDCAAPRPCWLFLVTWPTMMPAADEAGSFAIQAETQPIERVSPEIFMSRFLRALDVKLMHGTLGLLSSPFSAQNQRNPARFRSCCLRFARWEVGTQGLVFGGSGSGKTSLLARLAAHDDGGGGSSVQPGTSAAAGHVRIQGARLLIIARCCSGSHPPRPRARRPPASA